MSDFNKDILTEIPEELDKVTPSTIEEIEEVIKKDDDVYKNIVTAANINAIVQILINKGITTREEYTTLFDAAEKSCLRVAAQLILKEDTNNEKENNKNV